MPKVRKDPSQNELQDEEEVKKFGREVAEASVLLDEYRFHVFQKVTTKRTNDRNEVLETLPPTRHAND